MVLTLTVMLSYFYFYYKHLLHVFCGDRLKLGVAAYGRSASPLSISCRVGLESVVSKARALYCPLLVKVRCY